MTTTVADNRKLHDAIKENDIKTVKTCLNGGQDVNSFVDGEAPLHIACRLGYVSLMEVLLHSGADIFTPTLHRQETPLYLASMEGWLPAVVLLMQQNEIVNVGNGERMNALAAASRYGHHRIVEYLITTGGISDLDQTWSNGQTPLTMAVQHGHNEVVKVLLGSGCSVDCPDQRGFTALMTAVMYFHSKLVPILLDAGASFTCQKNPLHMACSNGDLPTMQELLKSEKCDVNVTQEQGYSALYVASELGFLDIVEELIYRGADPNKATTDTGNTPLFAAMEMPLLQMYICPNKSVTKIVHVLIQGGSNPSHVNNFGQTPLQVALSKKLCGAALLLLAAECTVHTEWWQNGCNTENKRDFAELYPIFLQELKNPRSLKRICRCLLRSILTSLLPYTHTIECLPLPRVIKNYLLYKDLACYENSPATYGRNAN